jgi:hypothetical protein
MWQRGKLPFRVPSVYYISCQFSWNNNRHSFQSVSPIHFFGYALSSNKSMSSSRLPQRPPFASLPLRESDPPFSAWGLYGPDDELGALNLLTDECVKEATKEIKTGMRIGLNLPLNIPSPPSHGRLAFTHKVVHKAPRNVHDDVVEMNTQVGRLLMNL